MCELVSNGIMNSSVYSYILMLSQHTLILSKHTLLIVNILKQHVSLYLVVYYITSDMFVTVSVTITYSTFQ